MRVAILGYDREGSASYEYFKSQGYELTICDQDPNKQIPEGADSHLGPDYLQNLDSFDLLVRTPGLKPSQILEANPDIADRITSGTNEFFKAVPTKNVIGVTGTKGKGTTSTLITKILEASGKKVFLGGNIGIPALSLLRNITEDSWVVLELSNFQLIDLKYSPHIAVCLMVIAEHLDWHTDMDEYIFAKKHIVMSQKPDDLVIYNAGNRNSIDIARSSAARKLWFRAEGVGDAITDNDELHQGIFVRGGNIYIGTDWICDTSDIALIGQHNIQNVCAAIGATWEITNHNADAIRSVIKSFTGLPFRIEYRATKDDIRYFNDSFATGPGSAMAALASVPGMKVMIMGGYERGLDLTELCNEIAKYSDEIRKIVIIGASGVRLAAELTRAGFTNFVQTDIKDMPGIVQFAKVQAEPGDAVVLSPAFASFDMFKNFEERGIKFNEAVEAL